MAKISGLYGLRPAKGSVCALTCPPYDVIKEGSGLERVLKDEPKSLYHITLGPTPKETLDSFINEGILITDEEPCYYVYVQELSKTIRYGVLAAVEVRPYEDHVVIRHEKTFDEKVKGRIKLMEETGYITEPIWLLAKTGIQEILEKIAEEPYPCYEFCSDFEGESDLCRITNRVYRVPADSTYGKLLTKSIEPQKLYIADGHHRYHSALKMGLNKCIAYICQADKAEIQAYNRVIKGKVSFDEIKSKLPLRKEKTFHTPEKHRFCIYTRNGIYSYDAGIFDEDDPVGRLDVKLLEETLYPHLLLDHSMILDNEYFDYYPEADLLKMQKVVDQGKYDIAVALSPVDPEELMAVAEAGLSNPEIVMPEKSTFFAPKILSGLILIPTEPKEV